MFKKDDRKIRGPSLDTRTPEIKLEQSGAASSPHSRLLSKKRSSHKLTRCPGRLQKPLRGKHTRAVDCHLIELGLSHPYRTASETPSRSSAAHGPNHRSMFQRVCQRSSKELEKISGNTGRLSWRREDNRNPRPIQKK